MGEVLCFPRQSVPALPSMGTIPFEYGDWMERAVWLPREFAESDENHLQAVVYFLLCDESGRAWCYRRKGGDLRLSGSLSCGLGGHVERRDDQRVSVMTTLRTALERELLEELGARACESITGITDSPGALVHEALSAVGRVHLGLLYVGRWEGRDALGALPDPALEPLGFMPLHVIAADERFELWSRLSAAWQAGEES